MAASGNVCSNNKPSRKYSFSSMVTISTEMTDRGGVAGAIEKFITRRVLRPMYEEELRLLEAAAADPQRTAAPATPRA